MNETKKFYETLERLGAAAEYEEKGIEKGIEKFLKLLEQGYSIQEAKEILKRKPVSV